MRASKLFKEKIDYLLLVNQKIFSLEVIKISKISELLKKEMEVWYEPKRLAID